MGIIQFITTYNAINFQDHVQRINSNKAGFHTVNRFLTKDILNFRCDAARYLLGIILRYTEYFSRFFTQSKSLLQRQSFNLSKILLTENFHLKLLI